MKKTAVKVIAVMIAVCVLLGAFPIGASAATRYAVTITYNGEYGYARMEQNELEAGQYAYINIYPKDACLIDTITVTDDDTGSAINAHLRGTRSFNDGTFVYVYRFIMPQSTVSVDVRLRPVKEEKQIELYCENDDLGFLRTDDGTRTAIPTAAVYVCACPLYNYVAGRDNAVKGVTCFTESGVEIEVSRYGTTPEFVIYTFTMPDENVRVTGNFAPPSGWRRLDRSATGNGKLTAPDGFAQVGSSVTVTAKPDPGYVLNALYYVDRDTGARTDINISEGQTEYTFTMPGADLTVYAHFGLSGDAHTITASCEGKLGGQIDMNTYVASPGETVSGYVIPYRRNSVRNILCINKSTGEEIDFTSTVDGGVVRIEFPMPDADVEIIASYIFPEVKLGDPMIYAYEDRARESRRADYDADTLTYSVEVYDDTELLELHIISDSNTITLSCAETGYTETAFNYFSRKVPLAEGVSEMTILCEVDDPNSGEHLSIEYTLLVSRTKRYIPVERVILEDGAEEKVLSYYRDSYYYRSWLPSVSYYPENAENQTAKLTSSDNSILQFSRPKDWQIVYGNEDGYYDPNDQNADQKFHVMKRSGIVTVTATTPDGASSSMKVIVVNGDFHGTLTYDPGEGSANLPQPYDQADPNYDSSVYYHHAVDNTDGVKLAGCTFAPPAGKVFKAWEYRGDLYAPGDWIFLKKTNETVTAVYEDMYTAVWLDGDGSVLDSRLCIGSDAITPTDKIPVKAADYYNTYTFDKWDDGTSEGELLIFRPLFTTHEKEQSTYLIHVNNLIGQPVTIEVESTDTVAAVKQKLCDADGTPTGEQYLVYNNTLLRDDMTLADYDIHKEAVLDMAHQGAVRTVVWLGADGEELARADHYKDEAEPAAHITPQKADDRTHTYTFDKWDEGTVNGRVKTYSPLWIAHEKSFYYIYVSGGTADSETAYPGDTVTLTAGEAPNSYMYHSGWTAAGDNVEIGDDNTFVMPDDHVYIYAKYALKKTPELSIDFSAEKAYLGKPLSISGDLRYDDEIIDVGGELTITFSGSTPEAEDAVSYSVPVNNGSYRLDIPAVTATGRYVWFEYPGEGIYGEVLVSTTINTYGIAAASLLDALYEEDIQTVYSTGEELNTEDLYIRIYWTDGTKEDYPVTPEMVSGFDSSAPGTLTLTVDCPYPYEGELTYQVTVAEAKVLLGDADGNGEVDVIDATVIQRYISDMTVPYPEKTLMNGDVDGDGELSVIDATYIQRYSASFDVPYPVDEWVTV